MGRRGGYVFVAEGGGEIENWVWLIVLRRGRSVGFPAHMTSRRRGRTHKVSNLQIMCQSFVRTNMYSLDWPKVHVALPESSCFICPLLVFEEDSSLFKLRV